MKEALAMLTAALIVLCGAFPATVAAQQSERSGIAKIEDAAEAVAEGEETGSSAFQSVDRVIQMWPHVRDAFAEKSVKESELHAVDSAIADLKAARNAHRDLRAAANDVTKTLAPLFALAGDRVPAAIHLLDYYQRAIALDAEAGSWSAAQAAHRAMKARWQEVRPHVMQRGGEAAAGQFEMADRALYSAIANRNVSHTVSAARQVGDSVDGLEKVFTG